MIDRDHDLPLTRQAAVLNISRGSLYYKPRPVSAADLALMRRMDELHLEFPFAVARCAEAGHFSSRSGWYERRCARRCGGRRFQGRRPTCERMTSFRSSLIESTGPKNRSWQTAIAAKCSSARIDRRNRRCRSLEDIEDYQAFEAAIIAPR